MIFTLCDLEPHTARNRALHTGYVNEKNFNENHTEVWMFTQLFTPKAMTLKAVRNHFIERDYVAHSKTQILLWHSQSR